MKLKLLILGAATIFATVIASRAAMAGWGVPRPIQKPLSLREGSERETPLSSGRGRTRFLIGGGHHGGK